MCLPCLLPVHDPVPVSQSHLFFVCFALLCVTRTQTNDPDVAGFNQPARWVPLVRDTDSPVTGDEDIPGFLLFRCVLFVLFWFALCAFG